MNSIQDILDFWYAGESRKKWFNSSAVFDEEIKQRFENTWTLAVQNQLDDWQDSAAGCLALCIVLDQFPLNMYRGEAKSFSSEAQSIEVAKHAIEKGLDAQIEKDKVSFLYMPLMHSENLADQDLCIQCFEKIEAPDNLRFAKHHRGIVEEFGRFPHRNDILDRESTAEELAYLQSKRAFTG